MTVKEEDLKKEWIKAINRKFKYDKKDIKTIIKNRNFLFVRLNWYLDNKKISFKTFKQLKKYVKIKSLEYVDKII